MRTTKLRIILPIFFFLILISTVLAQDRTINYFYGEECPHCKDLKPFLNEMEDKYPIKIRSFETWHNQSNSDIFTSMSAACGSPVVGVPTLFIGHKSIIGYDDAEHKGVEIENAIIEYLEKDEVDLIDHLGKNLTACPADDDKMINVPVLGKIDSTKISLPIFTIVIGALDGFNPCAMWVLMFLLTLLVYTKSRKKMFLIGGTFILVSGIVYYIFMAAWLNLFLFTNFLFYLRGVIGSLAVIIGLINIKELFFFKKGISLSIPEKAKPKLLKKMSKLVREVSLPASLLGVIVLAFTVNSIELLCTAGFPAIYTKVLAMQNLSPLAHYGYLLLYIIMYMIDDMVVFTIAVFTLSSKKLTEKQGKWMKFISGFMMLALGLLLIFKPELLMFG